MPSLKKTTPNFKYPQNLIYLLAEQAKGDVRNIRDTRDLKGCKAQLHDSEIGLVETFLHSGKVARIDIKGEDTMSIGEFINSYPLNQPSKPSIKK